MLFTTAAFLLVFLPIALAGFFAIGRWAAPRHAATWLVLASLVFYGHWAIEFTLLLVASIGVNFMFGACIHRARQASGGGPPDRPMPGAPKRWLVLGVAFNLALLGYFKYANFFVENLTTLLGIRWHIGRVVLPLGISFYSFTQIAFLVDAYRGRVHEYRWAHYALFVTYFPHLVAGPVLHHAQMIPQFRDPSFCKFDPAHFVGGLFIFSIGMFKKVVLADGIAPYADAVFRVADAGGHPDTTEAWVGALAYTLQLYFDFSGYSDMAIGLSWMFNVRLPFNFDSPYRARNIADFWRRWHMTLSAFLRDYLYIALGGNRSGEVRRRVNLAVTMLLGGLWHGASWQFVLWGGLHGAYLMLHRAFRALCGADLVARLDRSRAFALGAWALTMLAVVAAWVLFRAETLGGAGRVLAGLVGVPSTSGVHIAFWNAGLQWQAGATWCITLGALACLAPNSNRIGSAFLKRARTDPRLRGVAAGFVVATVLFLLAINTARDAVSAFIYFNF